MNINDLLAKKTPAATPKSAPATEQPEPSPERTASTQSPSAPTPDATVPASQPQQAEIAPAANDAFAMLRKMNATMSGGITPNPTPTSSAAPTLKPMIAPEDNPNNIVQTTDGAVNADDIMNMDFQLGGLATPTQHKPPSLDDDLLGEVSASLVHYQGLMDANVDNSLVHGMYTHMYNLCAGMRDSNIGDTLRDTMQYIEASPELRDILLPDDLRQMMLAIQASTGRVIREKKKREGKKSKNKVLADEAAQFLGNFTLGGKK